MKKILPLVFSAVFIVSASGQVTIPNGGFENWIQANNFHPKQFPNTSNKEVFYQTNLPFNLTRSTDAFHGTYAVKMETLISGKDSSGGYFVNSPNTDGNNWHGGVPFTEKPTGVRGYYKSNIATGDSGLILAAFSKAGVNIGTYFYKIGGVKSSWTLFDFELKPALTQTPDSVMFGATSSDLVNNVLKHGSTVTIDSVSFKGVTGQPPLLYGDFEIWENEFLYKALNWYSDRDGMSRSSDSYTGNYAAQLTTFIGNENNVVVARAGRISTGYYSDACHCMVGGYPYTLKKDTLVFYYKYAPVMANDSASINLNFKKNGVGVFGNGIWLGASATYKKVEMPFDFGGGTAPDSVIVEIQSSLWQHKATSYAGAVLKIDDINFKSQMLALGTRKVSVNNNISIYPNPTSGRFTVHLPDQRTSTESLTIEILNITGQKVLSSVVSRDRNDYDISDLPKGLYFAKFHDGDKVSIIKIIKR